MAGLTGGIRQNNDSGIHLTERGFLFLIPSLSGKNERFFVILQYSGVQWNRQTAIHHDFFG